MQHMSVASQNRQLLAESLTAAHYIDHHPEPAFSKLDHWPEHGYNKLLLPPLLAAPTWLWGRCGRHNSPPANSVMDFIFRCSDYSHVPVDTVHPYLLRSSSLFSPRWYHLQSLSSDVFLVSPLDVSKLAQSCFPAPRCDVLYFKTLPDAIVSHMVY